MARLLIKSPIQNLCKATLAAKRFSSLLGAEPFETADDLTFALALGRAPGNVAAGAHAPAHPAGCDPIIESPVRVKTKESLWQELLYLTSCDPTFALCNVLPSPGCLFASAYRCRRFRGCHKHARLKRARAVKARIRGS